MPATFEYPQHHKYYLRGMRFNRDINLSLLSGDGVLMDAFYNGAT